jgi:hypothetical protein
LTVHFFLICIQKERQSFIQILAQLWRNGLLKHLSCVQEPARTKSRLRRCRPCRTVVLPSHGSTSSLRHQRNTKPVDQRY